MIPYPKKLLQNVFAYLKRMERDLLRRQKTIADEDPFSDETRLNENVSDDIGAAAQFGHARSEALSNETKAALQRVRTAMQRIEKGTYGSCISCHQMIDTDRLGIDPTAELCISCAKKRKR